jgi:hypothetical protein
MTASRVSAALEFTPSGRAASPAVMAACTFANCSSLVALASAVLSRRFYIYFDYIVRMGGQQRNVWYWAGVELISQIRTRACPCKDKVTTD